MSTRTGQSPIDRGAAERILRGGRDAWSAGHDPIARLLDAATAPARPSELVLEEMAVIAFQTAHRSPVSQPQRQSMIRYAVAKLLTVKVAALAAAVVGVGGVALAASTGTISSPLHGAASSASHSPTHGNARPSDHPSGRPSDRPSKAAVPSGFPPGLYWLCQDYIGRDADHRGKALGESKFHELADRAGKERDKADRFCDKLLNDRPGAAPTAIPDRGGDRAKTPPGHPGGDADPPANRPSGLPTPHPHR
jgi:hypothetical protein